MCFFVAKKQLNVLAGLSYSARARTGLVLDRLEAQSELVLGHSNNLFRHRRFLEDHHRGTHQLLQEYVFWNASKLLKLG